MPQYTVPKAAFTVMVLKGSNWFVRYKKLLFTSTEFISLALVNAAY